MLNPATAMCLTVLPLVVVLLVLVVLVVLLALVRRTEYGVASLTSQPR